VHAELTTMVEHLLSRVVHGLRRRYHRLRRTDLLWRVLTHRARKAYHVSSTANSLSPAQIGIRDSLRAHGIAVTSFTDLFEGSDLERLIVLCKREWQRWQNDEEDFRTNILAQKKGGKKGSVKEFIVPLYGGGWTMPVLDLSNPFIAYALSDAVLRPIAAYLEVLPRFNSFALHATEVVAPGEIPQYSQRWHRDPEDRRMVKTFLYLNDVLDEGAGPFTYVRGSHDGGKWRGVFPQDPPSGVYPPEGAVESVIPSSDVMVCTGARGTLIFADTTGLHRGGLSTRDRRFMFSAGYVTDASEHPPKFKKGKQDDLGALSALGRAALPF